MHKFLLSLLIFISTFGLIITDAEAKRFGGGKSFGSSRSSSSFSSANNSSYQRTAQPATSANKWMGALSGLAIGGLLAYLFMGHGLGTGLLSWLLIAGAAFVLWRLIKGFLLARQSMSATNLRDQPAYSFSTNAPFSQPQSNTPQYTLSSANDALVNFDENAFLRHAKTVFIRLQAAYDNKNLTDLREFTSPEVFAEIQLQLQERGTELNQTEVIAIEAKLLNLTNAKDGHGIAANVVFAGFLREQPNTDPQVIKETWYFYKPVNQDNWIITGIEQSN